MTSSGTYNFNPSLSSLVIEAFDRCDIRPTALTREHFISANRSINLELSTWANRGVNLWKVEPFSIEVSIGTATYTAGSGVNQIPPNTVSMLDVYWSLIGEGQNGGNLDRVMLPISRTQWDELPNKSAQGYPTVYWYEKLISPTITFWQVPIVGYPTAQISGHLLSQVQDANASMGQTADVPYRGLEALTAGLASRLALKFSPERFSLLKGEAKEQWEEFSDADREDSPIHIIPQISSFFPR
jgi:hypothetical protein